MRLGVTLLALQMRGLESRKCADSRRAGLDRVGFIPARHVAGSVIEHLLSRELADLHPLAMRVPRQFAANYLITKGFGTSLP